MGKVSVIYLAVLLLQWANATSFVDIQVDGHPIKVEIADRDDSRQRGLMFRHHMDADKGMLFVFAHPQVLAFWMKNTFIPLAIGYFDANCSLIDIQEMAPVTSEMETPSINYVSKKEGLFALELNNNWFEKNKVKLLAKLELLHRPTNPTLKACYRKK
jgi:uncharacterized membrane protein (UPF0127 family)